MTASPPRAAALWRDGPTRRATRAGMTTRPAFVVSVLLLVLTGGLLWDRATTPSDGTVVQLSNRPWRADQITINFVHDSGSGLRAHDVVTAIDGRPLVSLAGAGLVRDGRQLTYTVIRDGHRRDVAVRLGPFPMRAFLAENLIAGLVLLSLFGVALFVFHRRPTDPAAQALLLTSAFAVCGTTAWLCGDQVVGLATIGPSLLDLAGELALAMAWGALLHFALVLPDTRLRPTRRACVIAYALPLVLHGAFLAVSLPSARTMLEAMGLVTQVSFVPGGILPVVNAAMMVVSYRSARDEQSRRRLRWVLVPLVLALAAHFAFWTVPTMFGLPVPPEDLVPLLFLPCTVTLAAAILRYRWFDVELIVRRSLLYTSLSGCVLAIYLATTWLLGRVIGPRPNLWVLLASALVALSAQPLRRHLQRRVGRLIYGDRDDPYEVVSRLVTIDAAAEPRRVLHEVAETLVQTLRLPYAAIELGLGETRPVIEASHGHALRPPSVHPLVHGQEVLGRLLLDVGPGREPFGPADRRLLDAVVQRVSAAASTVLLTVRLQASREQLVLAREEERRRLHHRLHDGLGPSLVGEALQMEIARKLLRQDSHEAKLVLEALTVRAREVISDVRGLVHDLRPPALDRLGLTEAIRERAAHLSPSAGDGHPSLRVDVEAIGSLEALPAAVEVAAFWIAIEAVNNAARHSGASTCHVRLVRDHHVTVEVEDDGRGLPDRVVPGGGFLSMRGRAEELGGEWSIARKGVGGALVRALLPIRPSDNRS